MLRLILAILPQSEAALGLQIFSRSSMKCPLENSV